MEAPKALTVSRQRLLGPRYGSSRGGCHVSMDEQLDVAGDEDDVFTRKNKLLGFGVVRDPLPKLHELQAQCPVHRGSISIHFGVQGPDTMSASEDGQVSVFGFPEVEEGWRDPARFSSSQYGESIGR